MNTEQMLAEALRRNEILEDVLERIYTWCDAYPIAAFTEPPWNTVHHTLQEAGLSLDAISASNMRHVVQGVKTIIDSANLPSASKPPTRS